MTAQVNILIAEDEANIALAIKTIVRKATGGGNVVTVGDGRAALAALQDKDFDLLISDWNMPHMTGLELLSQVRGDSRTEQLPFLMLTARADAGSVKSALVTGVTDYIAKPFDKDKLVDKVHRFLGDKLARPAAAPESVELALADAVRDRLNKGEVTFPILPEVAFRAVEVINSEDVSLQDVINVIKLDVSLTGKIIAVANSPYYRAVMPIQELQHAIGRIGFRDTGNLILMQATRDMFNAENPQIEERQHRLWEHALATAAAARVIGRRLEHPFPERLYAAGMLHDMGKLLLLQILMELSDVRDDVDEQSIDGILNGLHEEFGVALLKRWEFPSNFVEVAGSHHDYARIREYTLDTQVVAYANLLTRQMGMSLRSADEDTQSMTDLGKLLGIQQQHVAPMVDEVTQYVTQMIDMA